MSRSPARPQRDKGRILEAVAVVMLGAATVGSAWCAYQAARWNGEETELAREATIHRVEGSRLFGLATQKVAYDANLVAQYAQASVAGNEQLKTFIRTSLVRAEFLPVLDSWEAQVKSGVLPTNLLEDPAYMDAQFAAFRVEDAKATETSVRSDEAGDESNSYVLLTVVLATALFFAGVTTSFRFVFARLAMLAACGVLMTYAASRLIELPII